MRRCAPRTRSTFPTDSAPSIDNAPASSNLGLEATEGILWQVQAGECAWAGASRALERIGVSSNPDDHPLDNARLGSGVAVAEVCLRREDARACS